MTRALARAVCGHYGGVGSIATDHNIVSGLGAECRLVGGHRVARSEVCNSGWQGSTCRHPRNRGTEVDVVFHQRCLGQHILNTFWFCERDNVRVVKKV